MKIYKLSVVVTFFALLFIPAVHAAEDAVIFYPATKILSAAGQCEKKEVLILIYYAGTDKIWGSGNVKCQDGRYQYRQDFNDWKISDGEFEVEIFDGGYKAKKQSPNTEKMREIVIVEGMNLKNPAALTAVAPEDNNAPVDSGSVVSDAAASGAETAGAPEGDDNFFLNGVLNFFFGVVQNIGETIKNFSTIIAKTIKTTTLAAIKIFAKDLAIVPDGKISVPAGENQLSGRAVILAGTSQIKINNSKITEHSKIFLTALSEINLPLAVIEKNKGQGFVVGVSQVAEKDIAFDWLVIESYNSEADAGSSEDMLDLPIQVADENINSPADGYPISVTENTPNSSSVSAPEIAPSESAAPEIAEDIAASAASSSDLPEESFLPPNTEEAEIEESEEVQEQPPAENFLEAESSSEADNSTGISTESETAQ